MLVFSEERLENCWDEIYSKPDGIAYKHWNETQQHKHWQEYNPNREVYERYNSDGWFIQLTVRDGGRLVGYAGFYVVPSMHTRKMIATEDTWYLLPEYRKGMNAIKFYRFGEKVMQERGAVEITVTMPAIKSESMVKLTQFLGYNQIGTLHSKRLTNQQNSVK